MTTKTNQQTIRFSRCWVILLLLLLTTTNNIKAQSVIVTGGTYNGKTLAFNTATSTTIPYNLNSATAITVTGKWTDSQARGLYNALKNNIEPFGRFNNKLEKADLSGMSFTGTNINMEYSFAKYLNLKEIILPNTTVAIKTNFEYAFFNSTALTTIKNLEKFTKISSFKNTFSDCYALESFTLPAGNGNDSISFEGAFYKCEKLKDTSLTNLKFFTYIKSFIHTFAGCYLLKNVVLPSSTNAKSISFSNAFYDCYSLTAVTNLDKFTQVSDFTNIFSSCHSLKQIILPSGTDATGIKFYSAFANCQRLTSIINLEKFTNITDLEMAFEGCASLTSVYLGTNPSAVTNVTNTFSRANPNMLKYLPKNSTVPAAWGSYNNFINGNKASDNPTSYGDIVLIDNYTIVNSLKPNQFYAAPYECQLSFKIPVTNRATYIRDFTGQFSTDGKNGFQSVVLPFDVDNIAPQKLGDPCMPLLSNQYYIKEYKGSSANGKVIFDHTDKMLAYTPYLVAFKSGSSANNVTFYSANTGITMAATGSLTVTDKTSSKFTFTGTLLGTSGEAYYLNGNTDTFTKQTLNSSIRIDGFDDFTPVGTGSEAQPFRAYFVPTSSTGQTTLEIETILDCKIEVNLKAFLEGPMQPNGTMTNYMQEPDEENSLFLAPCLPIENPYGVKDADGNIVSYADINDAIAPTGQIVDWVWVEIWETGSDNASRTVLEEKALLIRPDGSIIDIDGSLPKFSPQEVPIHIVVKHRNHMAVMSNAITNFKSDFVYDFSTGLNKAYQYPGEPSPQMKQKYPGGPWCMFAGDLTHSGFVEDIHYQQVRQDYNAFREGDYLITDLNMNGAVEDEDFGIVFYNWSTYAVSSAAYFIQ